MLGTVEDAGTVAQADDEVKTVQPKKLRLSSILSILDFEKASSQVLSTRSFACEYAWLLEIRAGLTPYSLQEWRRG